MKLLFYSIYSFCVVISKTLPSSAFAYPKYDSIFWLSAFEWLNIITLWIYFSLKPISYTYESDLIISALVLLSINWLYFIRNKRYEKIYSEINKNGNKAFLANIITLVYCVLSFYFFLRIYFYKIH